MANVQPNLDPDDLPEVAQPRLPGVVPRRVAGWPAIVEAYLTDYKDKTRRNYAHALDGWSTWCEEQGFDPLAASSLDIRRYKDELLRGHKPRTVALALVAINGVYKLAVFEDLMDRNPADRVKRPPVNRRAPRRWLTTDEIRAVLRVARAAGPLEHALIRLLANNGLRIEEICNADVTDIVRTNGRSVLFVEGKGDKERLAPLAPSTVQAIEAHLGTRARGPLLQSRRGNRLSPQTAWRIVRRLGEAAELGPPGIHPHSFRRSFATISKQHGIELQDVQHAMGHEDPRTTQLYDQDLDRLDEHPTWQLARLFDDADEPPAG